LTVASSKALALATDDPSSSPKSATVISQRAAPLRYGGSIPRWSEVVFSEVFIPELKIHAIQKAKAKLAMPSIEAF
jgi:hypothetical protein